MGGSWRIVAGKKARLKTDKLSNLPKSMFKASPGHVQRCKQPSLQHSQASIYSESHLELDEAEEEG